jgi:hypothetical protein
VDNDQPTSTVLPPVVVDSTLIQVSWTGNDGEGAGLAGVSLFMRRNLDEVVEVGSGLTGNRLDLPVEPGHAYYFMTRATDQTGNVEPPKEFETVVLVGSGPVAVKPQDAPGVTALSGVVPNPARGEATVQFDLARPEAVTLELFDLQGRRVLRILDGRRLEAGRHAVPVPRHAAGPGVYFLRMYAGSYTQVRRMVWLR